MFNIKTILTTDQLLTSIYQTLYMVSLSLFIGAIIGCAMAIVLIVTRPHGISENKFIFRVLSFLINIIRSVPSLILVAMALPLSYLVLGKSYGTNAIIIPLIFFVSPYIARLFENSLLEVNDGIIEAANAMGATTWQVIWHFLLPEARISLVLSFTTAAIGLTGASAIAGNIGAGGLGDIALNIGYQRNDNFALIVSVVILIIIIQIIQSLGNFVAKSMRKNYRRH